MNDADLLRYSRHILLPEVDLDGQEKLLKAKVAIIGLGGLGSPVALYLAASGIGEITLVDGDLVDLGNLQRQIIHTEADLTHNKVDSAARALLQINSTLKIIPVTQRIKGDALDALVTAVDAVVDCTDNLAARQQLNAHCYQRKLPFVSASALGWEGQIMAFDFAHNSSLCLNCIINKDSAEPIMNCGNSGVVGPVLGAMGSLQATTVIRILLGFFQQHGQVQRYDGKAGQWLALKAQADKECAVCGS